MESGPFCRPSLDITLSTRPLSVRPRVIFNRSSDLWTLVPSGSGDSQRLRGCLVTTQCSCSPLLRSFEVCRLPKRCFCSRELLFIIRPVIQLTSFYAIRNGTIYRPTARKVESSRAPPSVSGRRIVAIASQGSSTSGVRLKRLPQA